MKNSIFWTLCIMGTFAILSSTMSKNPVLKPFASSLGTPADWSGIVGAASTIPGILVSLPAASLSDILGRKKFLLIAGFVFASAPFLYILIVEWWQLIIVRFYHGFATAIFVPVAEASIAEAFPTKRGERISLFSSSTYIGRGIAPILGVTILTITNSNFHALYLAVGVAGLTALITAVPFLIQSEENITQQKKRENIIPKMFQGWRTTIRNRVVLIVCLVQACQYYVYGAFEFYMSGYLKEFIGFDWLLTGIITASLIAVPIFSKPYMGRVSDKIGRRIPIVMGCIISGFPLLAVPFFHEFSILLLLSVVYGLGFATVTAATPALISELTPKEFVGTAMGFLDMIMDIGQTIGPIISGLIFATYLQYAGVFPSFTLVLLFSCAIFILPRTSIRKEL
ncbi:MAG: MFS transporter [Candidatus Bathycorpusculaceae bacterium]